ncbi:hypothetical protein VKT23_019432 [Stygiomarasmius scandens]|uniref:F-box domain-containing protein n=1 Tax=Marasmiellus scandens TaxID=2682957 RepID=A0ABR1ILG3_9AGAR
MFIKQADFMTRVPPELWKEIFESVCVGGNLFGLEFITPPSPQATLRLQLAHVRPALFLSSVCKHWRTIALSTPILWSNFKVFCSPHFVDFRLMDLAIQRSQTQPLTITIHGSFPCPNSTRPFRHLVTTSARWINFHFLGDGMQPDSPGYVELKRILFYEISQVPILRSIGTNTTLLSSNLPWVQSAPKLSSLALIRHDGLVPKEDYPWERITQLHLGKRFYSTRAQDVIAGVLLHCANLTKLELRDIFFGSQTLEPSSPVVLRHLAMLSIIQQERHFIRLLDSVRDEMALPALVSLELTFVGSRTSSDEETVP